MISGKEQTLFGEEVCCRAGSQVDARRGLAVYRRRQCQEQTRCLRPERRQDGEADGGGGEDASSFEEHPSFGAAWQDTRLQVLCRDPEPPWGGQPRCVGRFLGEAWRVSSLGASVSGHDSAGAPPAADLGVSEPVFLSTENGDDRVDLHCPLLELCYSYFALVETGLTRPGRVWDPGHRPSSCSRVRDSVPGYTNPAKRRQRPAHAFPKSPCVLL